MEFGIVLVNLGNLPARPFRHAWLEQGFEHMTVTGPSLLA